MSEVGHVSWNYFVPRSLCVEHTEPHIPEDNPGHPIIDPC